MYYASRKLTDTELRYSQFEREALGVYWACKRFYLYLIGIEFEILTDHKPLVSVLGAKSKPQSARIERWLLQLQQYSYTIMHIPGKANRADILSRTPVPDDATTRYVAEDCAYRRLRIFRCTRRNSRGLSAERRLPKMKLYK